MNLSRLWELIIGLPHLHKNSDMVNAATISLTHRTEELANAVRPYTESEDPLVMFMTDVFNRREMRTHNGQTKFHP